MKLKTAALIILLFIGISQAIFAQIGDARTRGMANAFTAVADDHNALYFNPAGLAFLKDTDFSFGIDWDLSFSMNALVGEERYPEPYLDSNGQYVYQDESTGTETPFEPADYDFDNDSLSPVAYDQTVDDYLRLRKYYLNYKSMQSIPQMDLFPNFAYASKNWGFANIYDLTVKPIKTEFSGEPTDFSFDVSHNIGIMGGVGIEIGGIGLGANVKYYTRTTNTIHFSEEEAETGPSGEFFSAFFTGSEEGSVEGRATSHFEVGVGALLAIDSLSIGIYSDNILGFVNEAGGFSFNWNMLETMSLGAAYTPFNRKNSDKKGFLNLILSGDLKNLGDNDTRVLALGAETGLHLGQIIMLDGRLGYSQPLSGGFSNGYTPRSGTFSIGCGGRFLIGTMNITLQLPGSFLYNPDIESMSEEELESMYGALIMDFNITL
ncbi:MAG: hypothetical protein JEY99_21740 [Spirochaetales bacterium]|nr:hypothetical protein [Spirochaetales bacterium]